MSQIIGGIRIINIRELIFREFVAAFVKQFNPAFQILCLSLGSHCGMFLIFCHSCLQRNSGMLLAKCHKFIKERPELGMIRIVFKNTVVTGIEF